MIISVSILRLHELCSPKGKKKNKKKPWKQTASTKLNTIKLRYFLTDFTIVCLKKKKISSFHKVAVTWGRRGSLNQAQTESPSLAALSWNTPTFPLFVLTTLCRDSDSISRMSLFGLQGDTREHYDSAIRYRWLNWNCISNPERKNLEVLTFSEGRRESELY